MRLPVALTLPRRPAVPGEAVIVGARPALDDELSSYARSLVERACAAGWQVMAVYSRHAGQHKRLVKLTPVELAARDTRDKRKTRDEITPAEISVVTVRLLSGRGPDREFRYAVFVAGSFDTAWSFSGRGIKRLLLAEVNAFG